MSEMGRLIGRTWGQRPTPTQIVPGLWDRYRLRLTYHNRDTALLAADRRTKERSELRVRCQADIEQLPGDTGRNSGA